MALYDTKSERIYPVLPSAPEDDGSLHRLKTIKEIEAFLNDEVITRSRLHKKFKRCRVFTNYINHGLATTTVIASAGGIGSILSGLGAPIAIALGAVGITATLAQGITKRLESIYNTKSQKHNDICVIAQTILDGITISISKAIQDGTIDHSEFQKIGEEKQRYLTRKQEIRSKAKKVVSKITKAQREEILEVGRKEGREEVAKKLVKDLDIQHVPVI